MCTDCYKAGGGGAVWAARISHIGLSVREGGSYNEQMSIRVKLEQPVDPIHGGREGELTPGLSLTTHTHTHTPIMSPCKSRVSKWIVPLTVVGVCG